MRIGLIMASLALLAAPVTASHAAPEDPKAKPPARLKLPTDLRGSVSPEPPAQARPAAPQKPAPVRPTSVAQSIGVSLASPIPAAKPDEGQCRTSCAHTYYFCLSSPGSTDCGASWSQCLTDCGHPPLSIDR